MASCSGNINLLFRIRKKEPWYSEKNLKMRAADRVYK